MWLIGNKIKQAFTFIELMITLVILMAGLVAIIQGFITAAHAVNNAQNNIAAIQFLDSKMQELEAGSRKNNGIKKDALTGNFTSDTRAFNWSLDIAAVEKSQPIDLSEDLNEVRLSVSWQERGLSKDLSVLTYLRNKKE